MLVTLCYYGPFCAVALTSAAYISLPPAARMRHGRAQPAAVRRRRAAVLRR